MGLNKTKGNMYEFITHTWNVIKGECYHDCSYCYMKRWGKLNQIRFDEKELKTDLGSGNFIFVGSSNDMFANGVNKSWVEEVIGCCKKFDNKYLLQTKNPHNYKYYDLDERFVVGATIESNRYYEDIYGLSPTPKHRSQAMAKIKNKKFITIEPILDFDLDEFVEIIKEANPEWVNIGADTGNNGLPEPTQNKIDDLIKALSFAKITIKKNMKRIST